MSSTQVIREIFGLSRKERIFDDFSCAYKNKILVHGRIYLTENYIWFYSNVLGIKQRVIIELKKIKEIKKKNTLGLIPNALAITAEDGATYKFLSFSQRNTAYKSFVAIWKNVSKYGKDFQDDEETVRDDESESEHDLLEEQKGKVGFFIILN